jgi:hypothetical protein
VTCSYSLSCYDLTAPTVPADICHAVYMRCKLYKIRGFHDSCCLLGYDTLLPGRGANISGHCTASIFLLKMKTTQCHNPECHSIYHFELPLPKCGNCVVQVGIMLKC